MVLGVNPEVREEMLDRLIYAIDNDRVEWFPECKMPGFESACFHYMGFRYEAIAEDGEFVSLNKVARVGYIGDPDDPEDPERVILTDIQKHPPHVPEGYEEQMKLWGSW